MTKIKLCGLKRACDAEFANVLLPDFAGFVFAPQSSRFVDSETALNLRKRLRKEIVSVGVFVNEKIETILALLDSQTIEAVQLHGQEDETFIQKLRAESSCRIFQAFQITSSMDIERANQSSADCVLLDSGGGTGTSFNHSLLSGISRPCFLAGGLTSLNVGEAIRAYRPWGVDASSALETDGLKDFGKMQAFVNAVRDTDTRF